MGRYPKPSTSTTKATSTEPSEFTFDADPGRARHARAMRRVYESELERARYYWDKHGVPFEESELAGYAYRDPNG